MTVAVDSNIIIDLLHTGGRHHDSQDSIQRAGSAEDLIICEVVFAELAAEFKDERALQEFLSNLGVALVESSGASLHRAGIAFAAYSRRRGGFRCTECGSRVSVTCPQCGSLVTRRQHVLADFMIGAHALVHADRLLTRDRGYYSTYFPDLILV